MQKDFDDPEFTPLPAGLPQLTPEQADQKRTALELALEEHEELVRLRIEHAKLIIRVKDLERQEDDARRVLLERSALVARSEELDREVTTLRKREVAMATRMDVEARVTSAMKQERDAARQELKLVRKENERLKR